jgi:hypothetical protein
VETHSDGPDDAYWRRPERAQAAPDEAEQPAPPQPPHSYAGPPPTAPPPPDWRPPVVHEPAAPRSLPEQDPARLDEEEASARTLTYGIGMVAGAVLLVVICLLCSRVVF